MRKLSRLLIASPRKTNLKEESLNKGQNLNLEGIVVHICSLLLAMLFSPQCRPVISAHLGSMQLL